MRHVKIFVPIALVAILAIGWLSAFSSFTQASLTHGGHIALADESYESGLYGQAIEELEAAADYGDGEDAYVRIREIYEVYYAEEPTARVRDRYLDAMLTACDKYPSHPEFWEDACNLYLESKNSSKAFALVKRAQNRGITSDVLDELYETLLYTIKLDYKLYSEAKTALNGYFAVCDGAEWMLLDETGVRIDDGYKLIGLVNDDGYGLYVNSIDARLQGDDGIPRARFGLEITDAGCYDEESGIIPVECDGSWRFLKVDSGEFVGDEYDEAGSFYAGLAAVRVGDEWRIVTSSGEVVGDTFEDIKLDLYGGCVQSDMIIGKRNGKYGFYNANGERKGDFECDDIDICVHGAPIAYAVDGEWGYVDVSGTVVCEPCFHKAKSFANGMAAVADSKNHWGFINDQYEVVIDYEFLDAFYFNASEVALVTNTEDTYQILRFAF